MTIPKYIQDLMKRSRFVLGSGSPGYTIKIYKSTEYVKIPTLKTEIERLQKWVDRMLPDDGLNVPTMIIEHIPENTHYCKQCAIVTIYDPIMQQLEKYIPKNDDYRVIK